MEKKDTKNAKKALIITTILTIIVAGYEFFNSCQNYENGMNLLDFASYANSNLNVYCLVLILANVILLPSALFLYKKNKISLKKEIYEKESLKKDILLGIILAVISSLISLFSLVVNKGRTELAFSGWNALSIGQIFLMIISLGLVSGICKEIFFRGLCKNFCADYWGENFSFLLFNIMFGLLDWFNMGHSFIVGLIWIWGYKRSKHLIVPMIAHGGMNLISIVFYILTL